MLSRCFGKLTATLAVTFGLISLSLCQGNLLNLPFEGNPTGSMGESPTSQSGISYAQGVIGKAAVLGRNSVLTYAKSNNFNEKEGTLTFWVRPGWNGNDGNNEVFATVGAGGGMTFFRDHTYLRIIVDRYVAETDAIGDLSSWTPGKWHHAAFSWSNSSRHIKVYIDGNLVGDRVLNASLPSISDPTLWVGSDFGGTQANSTLDEFEIFDHALSDGEIASIYLAGVRVSSLKLAPTPLTLPETWTRQLSAMGTTANGMINIPPTGVTWTSSDTSVASVSANGVVTATRAGHALITGSVNGVSGSVDLTVRAPIRPPLVEDLDGGLADPPVHSTYDMPVVILTYIPTKDGVNVDSDVADYVGTVDSLRAKIKRLSRETKFMLTEGSRYHGYKDPNARPALGYRAIKMITCFEELPPDLNPTHNPSGGPYTPDYIQILNRFGMKTFVNNLGAKEVWLWGYHHGSIVPVESDMASPTTGDISNSLRFNDDLPIYARTYTLYNYNFTRSSSESVHDHGHQLEAIYGYTAVKQDGNDDLFWKLFDGRDANGNKVVGRCGNTHMPPNTTVDYDYDNLTLVQSDCMDWNPMNTGAKTSVNADTWGSINYAWPDGMTPDDVVQHNYYIFWMQNMCGLEANIPHPKGRMTNWWALTGDWDDAAAQADSRWGLYATGIHAIYVTCSAGIISAGDSAYLTISLANPAPAGGAVISLSSVGTLGGLATVPSSVTVAAGQQKITTIARFLKAGGVRISAAYGGKTLAYENHVQSSVLKDANLSSSTVHGGQQVTLTITLNHAAGPGGTIINLSSPNAALVVPATVTVPYNATSTTIVFNTKPVSETTSLKLKVSNSGIDDRYLPITITH